MTNSKFFMMVLDILEKMKYTIEQVKIFDDDFGMEFYINGIRGWRFGLRGKFDENSNYVVFCSHEDNIDKFKPSYCNLKFDVPFDDDLAILNWTEYHLNEMILTIKRHPIFAYYTDVHSFDSPFMVFRRPIFMWYIDMRFWALRRKIGNWYREKALTANKSWRTLNKMKKYLCKNFAEDIEKIEVIDRNDNKHGYTSSPRFQLKVLLKSDVPDNYELNAYLCYKVNGDARFLAKDDVDVSVYQDSFLVDFSADYDDWYNFYGKRAKLFGRKKYKECVDECLKANN